MSHDSQASEPNLRGDLQHLRWPRWSALSFPGLRHSATTAGRRTRPGPKVVVSFAPLYCFAVNVAGDDAVVRNMMTTTGPHHFNPTDRDARLLRRPTCSSSTASDWKATSPTDEEGQREQELKIVELGGAIPADKLFEGSCHHDHGDGRDARARQRPARLAQPGLRDPASRGHPRRVEGGRPGTRRGLRPPRRRVRRETQQLKADGLALLKDKKDRKIVTFHDSMTYFAKTFDLKIVGVVQKKPGTEPNGQATEGAHRRCARTTSIPSA